MSDTHTHHQGKEHTGCSCGCSCGCDHHEESEHPVLDKVLFIGGISLFVLVFLFEHISTLPEIPFSPVFYAVAWLCLGWEVAFHAVTGIFHGELFDENFLMTVATLGAFCIGDFPEAAAVMLFFRVGEYFEDKAVDKSRASISAAVDMRPETVQKIKADDSIETIPAEEAVVGDCIVVRPGDRIPLDGEVIKGESRIDTSPVTGEPVPIKAEPGSALLSGCVNTDGLLHLRVTKPLSESMVSRILTSVEEAAESKPHLDRFITRFARIYTPIVCLVALITAIVPSLITGNWSYYIYTALTFLVISCPCALVLSVPLAFFAGIGTGSRKGILFKGGSSIEMITKLKAVVMDKTGTITIGNFAVQKIETAEETTAEELLTLAAGMEQSSTHPIALSIMEYAHQKNITPPETTGLSEVAGKGLSAEIDGKKILCGNRTLLIDNKISVPDNIKSDDKTLVLLASDQIYLGYIALADTIKPTSEKAVRKMKQNGIYTVMLTGDNEQSASLVGKKVGIDTVYGKLLPEEKLTRLQQVRSDKGAVMFVGDGINDAPVLAGADVGAAMGDGADAAIEAADVVFMTSDLMAVPESISLARQTLFIARQNIIFALVIKIGIMALSFFGLANMWLAVFADSGVALLCVLNSVRMLLTRRR
ncbi:MAG: cadmium-translocating P-type ATPase [Lachnospiraceae bacterium]|nr:cadmium-translocating P-type ATPase [Lachnospiraceae bacterium]